MLGLALHICPGERERGIHGGMMKWTGFSAEGRRGDRDDSCHHLWGHTVSWPLNWVLSRDVQE